MCTTPETITSGKLMGAMPFTVYRLANGMVVALLQNHISSVASCLLHYRVGSTSERDGKRGLAHFFEHMMFRETNTLADGDFDRIVSELGGVGLNAFTSYDTTAYHVSVSTPQLEKILHLEAERMVRLQLSDEQIEAERGAVLGEILMYQDMPSEQLANRMMAEAFQQHAYQYPIIGYYDQVAAFGRKDFEDFYQRHYAPNQAVLVVAGGFDEQQVLRWANDAFGALPAGTQQSESQVQDAPWEKSRQIELRHSKVQTETLLISWRSSGVQHPDYPTLILMTCWLSVGSASPLYQELVRGGLAAYYSFSLQEQDLLLCDPALIIMEAGLNPGISCEQVEEAFQQLLKKLAQNPPPEADMLRALNQLRLGIYSVLEHNMHMARMLGGGLITCNDPLHGEKILQQVERTTAADLQQILNTWLLQAPHLCLRQRPETPAAASPS